MKVIRNGVLIELSPEEIAEREAEAQAAQAEHREQANENMARAEIARSISDAERIELLELAVLDLLSPSPGHVGRQSAAIERIQAIRGILSEARLATSENRDPDFTDLPRPTRG